MLWFVGVAMAGMLVGPEGRPAPTTTRSRIATTRVGERTDATITSDIQGASGGFGWLLAVPAGPISLEPGDALALSQLDAWSAPAVRAPTCGDLIQARPVGCGEELGPLPAVPVDHPIAPMAGLANGTWDLVVLDETLGEVTSWLADHGWVAPEGGSDEIARLSGVGQVFAAAAWIGPPPVDGAWLPPLRVGWDEPTWEIPLRFTHFNSSALHDAVVLTLTDLTDGTPFVPNYVAVTLEHDCLPPEADADAWYDAVLDETLPLVGVIPGVLVEQALPLDGCSDCPPPPPAVVNLGWLSEGTPWVGRLHLRYAPIELDQDPSLKTPGSPIPLRREYWSYRHDLEWAFPVCGKGYQDDPGACEPVHLATRSEAGCATSPTMGLAAVALGAVALRRRRTGILALALAGRSAAAAEGDPAGPRTALSAELPVWSTPRLADDETGERGAPSSLYPWIGVAGQVAFFSDADTTLAVSGGVRAFGGRASTDPTEQYVLWTLVEPHLGVSCTRGRFGPAFASPIASVGVDLALAALDASVYRPQLSVGPLVHARAGVWLGHRDNARTELAILLSAIPLAGAQIVDFHPDTGLPGWRFNRGTANVQLAVGGVWARPTSPAPPTHPESRAR